MTIADTTPIGDKRCLVRLQSPAPAQPDTEGGYSEGGWTDLDPPTWNAAIQSATAANLETIAGGTTMTQATHLLRGAYHPRITVATRVVYKDRWFSVVGVANVDEANRETVAVCVEGGHTLERVPTPVRPAEDRG